ncbi:hypothetical protein C4D60_Mb03t21430 [Musa balbisiana]|uniref:Uncharacterized protein n=1 Tax=Musa balbisiana TaxID=52838 RepID=A0A4S8JBM2_MUSBA|nr:hypothetical protein C4D60_Mb03t21430 [Musa balbisiana]
MAVRRRGKMRSRPADAKVGGNGAALSTGFEAQQGEVYKSKTGTRKVSLVHQSKIPSDSSPSSDRGKLTINDAVKWDERKTCLKSNMKKPSKGYSMVCEADDARELLEEADNKMSCCTVGRKVQWTDKCGKELAEIREFEASDDGLSDDDFEGESFRRCECVIQ